MKYYINRKIDATFEQAVDRVKELLQIEGFGVLSEVDLSEKIKEKLNVNFRRYKILSAYDTAYAYKALKKDDKIGIMLACNIIIQELRKNEIEVAAIDPVASMKVIKDHDVATFAAEIKVKLERVIASLHTGVESYGLV